MLRIVLIFLIGLPLSALAQPFFTQEAFLERISAGNEYQVDTAFNKLKDYREEKFFSLMESIYEEPSDFVAIQHVTLAKIHAADILVQGYMNANYTSGDLLADIDRFSRSSAVAVQGTVAQVAIRIVGFYDQKEGFDLLIGIIEDGEPARASSATLALASMCNSFILSEFERAVDMINSDSLREKVREQGVRHYEKMSSSSWCDRRQLP